MRANRLRWERRRLNDQPDENFYGPTAVSPQISRTQ
jgi:hypothetical protein